MLLIKNVRLEKGYVKQDDYVKSTETEIKDILIDDNGLIKSIKNEIETDERYSVFDAQKQLLVPALKEKHIHIDKTYFSGPWKAVEPMTEGRLSRFKEELEIMPKQLSTLKDRARAMVDHLIRNGHTSIRTHINVDPSINEENMKLSLEVIKEYEDKIDFEIVAFPQHGLLRNGEEFEKIFEKAVALGATHVGGLDPATIERNIEKTINRYFDLAEKYDIGIDIHLHEYGNLGKFIINRMIDIKNDRNFTNNLTLSHVYCLSQLNEKGLNEILDRIKENNIEITSALPIKYIPITIPVKQIYDKGILMGLGHDSLTDHWSPFGTGDTIQKLNILVEKFKYVDEFNIGQSLKYATGGITPLNESGEQVWPKENDEANFMLVDGISSAHLIARRCPISLVVSKGNIIHQNEFELKGAYR